jgi:hypothetical protein
MIVAVPSRSSGWRDDVVSAAPIIEQVARKTAANKCGWSVPDEFKRVGSN